MYGTIVHMLGLRTMRLQDVACRGRRLIVPVDCLTEIGAVPINMYDMIECYRIIQASTKVQISAIVVTHNDNELHVYDTIE